MLKYLFMFITISVVTGVFAWWQVDMPIEKVASSQEEEWKLPSLPKIEKIRASYVKLQAHSPWKSNEATKPIEASKKPQQEAVLQQQALPPPKKADWQLMGIIQQGPHRYILLLDDKTTKITSYSLKNTLPNGDTLLNIHEDFIEVLRKGKTEIVRLYQ